MWDLIVSVPDHCLSFYFFYYKSAFGVISNVYRHIGVGISNNLISILFAMFICISPP